MKVRPNFRGKSVKNSALKTKIKHVEERRLYAVSEFNMLTWEQS